MKIVNLVLNNFVHDNRVERTSVTLGKAGAEVSVVALHDKRLPDFESREWFDVHRLLLRSKILGNSKLINLIKFTEFIIKFSSNFRGLTCIHCNDLPALVVGVLYKLTSIKTKIIYDSHEYSPNDKPGQTWLSIFFRARLESFLIKYVENVITVSGGIARLYRDNYKIRLPVVVHNTPDFQPLLSRNDLRDIFNINEDSTLFVYVGVVAKGRGLEKIIDAFEDKRLQEASLVVVGYGAELSKLKARAKNQKNIFFHDAVPPEQLHQLISSADFGLALIEDTCISERLCLPNKLFEYVMAGKPVVVSNLQEMSGFVDQHKIGHVLHNIDSDSILEALPILKLISQDMSGKKLLDFRNEFSWENQSKKILQVYGFLDS